MATDSSIDTIFSLVASSRDHDALIRHLATIDKSRVCSKPLFLNAIQAQATDATTAASIFLLNACFDSHLDPESLLLCAQQVANTADGAQFRHVRRYLSSFARHVAKTALSSHRPAVGAAILRALLQKFPVYHTVTPVHAEFARVSLHAKIYDERSFALLDKQVFDVDNAKEWETTTADVLSYGYYSGVLYTGADRWADALEAFKMCFAVPGQGVSAIQVEAYRKYILVGLLHTGSSLALPKTCTPSLPASLAGHAQEYIALAKAFSGSTPLELQDLAAASTTKFTAHGNQGLVSQVLASHVRSRIERLTRTYVTVSLADVAAAAGVGSTVEAEGIVGDMIASGALSARIDGVAGIVRFNAAIEAAGSTAATGGAGGVASSSSSSAAGGSGSAGSAAAAAASAERDYRRLQVLEAEMAAMASLVSRIQAAEVEAATSSSHAGASGHAKGRKEPGRTNRLGGRGDRSGASVAAGGGHGMEGDGEGEEDAELAAVVAASLIEQ